MSEQTTSDRDRGAGGSANPVTCSEEKATGVNALIERIQQFSATTSKC